MNLVKWIKNLKGLKKFRSFVSHLFHFSTSNQQLVTGHVDKHAKKIKNRKAIIKKTKKQVQMDKVLEDKFKIKESDFNRISQIITSEPNIEQAVKDTLQYNDKLHTGLNLGDLGFIKRHDLIATLDGSYHVNVISNHDKVADKAKADLHKVIKRKETLFALPKDGMHLITHSTINKAIGIIKATYFAQLQSKISILEKRRINNVKHGGDVSIEKKVNANDKKSSAKLSDAQSFAASLTASASGSSEAKSSAKSASASNSASESASDNSKSATPEAKKKQSIDEQIAKAHKVLKALDKQKKQLEAKPSSSTASSTSSSASTASKGSKAKTSASSAKSSTASKATTSAKSSKASKKSATASSAKSSKASKASAKSKKASASSAKSSASKPAKPYNMPNLNKKAHTKAKKNSKGKASAKSKSVSKKNKAKAKQKSKTKNTIKKPYQMKSAKSSSKSKKSPVKAKKSKAKSKKRVVILPN